MISTLSSEPAHSATYNWKLASVLPASHPVHQALVIFADKVKEKTKGEVVITVFPAGQLGQEKDYIEGAKLGSIEITKVSSAPLGQFAQSVGVPLNQDLAQVNLQFDQI
jgi:TRAP-type C4-dicarboxylate transport system substrate-binding protein